jgi:hypothetical protein
MQTLDVPLGDVPLHVRGGSIVHMQRAASTTTEVRNSPVTLVVALEHEGTKLPTASTPKRCTAFSRRATIPPNVAAAAAAADDSEAELAAVAGSVAAAATAAAGSGMPIVACGQLYVDDGESLQVPPAQGYLLTQLTAAATADYSKGLLSSLPVTAAATAAAAGADGDVGVAEAAAARDTAAAQAEDVAATAAGFNAPTLEAVVVLGLPNKAAGGADAWAVKVNGNALAASQMQYDAAGQMLGLSGLQQQLTKGFAVQWERAA